MDTTPEIITDKTGSKASILKTVVFFVVALLIISLIIWFVFALVDSGKTGGKTNSTPTTQGSDPVKETGTPNGDNTPSSEGTGPGTDNSLLGPQSSQ